MFQDLAAATGNTVAVIVVMLLAMALFGLVVWGLVRMSDADARAFSRLPLDERAGGDGATAGEAADGQGGSHGTV